MRVSIKFILPRNVHARKAEAQMGLTCICGFSKYLITYYMFILGDKREFEGVSASEPRRSCPE